MKNSTSLPTAPVSAIKGYQEAADFLAAKIISGELRPGTRLGSERKLSEALNISRVTVRAALAKLEADGLIYSKSRRGWFVSPPRFIYRLDRRANYKAMAQAQGRRARVDLLSCGKLPDEALPEAMRAQGCGGAYRLQRIRYLDELPVMFETIYLRADTLPDLPAHDLTGSVTQLLADDYHIEITREDTSVRSSLLEPEQAIALGVAPGTPSLTIERRRYTENQLVEFDNESWLPGAIEIRLSQSDKAD